MTQDSNALRERLSQPAQEPVRWLDEQTGEVSRVARVGWTPLYTTTQPAQQQEPVQEAGWQALPAGPIKVLHQCRAALIGPVADGLARRCAIAAIDAELAQPAQQEQEPVCYRQRLDSGSYTYCNTPQFFDSPEPLYRAPQPRQWQGLTDEELKRMWVEYRAAIPRYLCFARAIAAKLREKNA